MSNALDLLRRVAPALFAVGCAAAAPDSHIGGHLPDAAPPIADARVNSGPTGRMCDLGKPFGTPVSMTSLNSVGNETGAWLSDDELTIYLSSSRSGNGDIFVAKRSDASNAFDAPAAVGGLNTADVEMAPFASADQTTMYFARNHIGEVDLLTAQRDAQGYAMQTRLATVNQTSVEDTNPWLSGDGLTLYFTSSRDGGDDDLFRATRTALTAPFAAPVKIPELASNAEDLAPVVSSTGLEILFASSRASAAGTFQFDVFRATRASTDVAFDAPTKLAELSDPTAGEIPAWLSKDGCVLYFTSNRGGHSDFDLWMTQRPR